jgi:hypothetical protein
MGLNLTKMDKALVFRLDYSDFNVNKIEDRLE